METRIESGQVYLACDGSGYRYRVDAYQPGAERVQVTDTRTGRRKQVKAFNLHTDQSRRTGYLLQPQE